MNSPALLLAFALPAASAVTRGVVATTQAVSEGFKNAFESVSDTAESTLDGSSGNDEPTLPEKLGTLASSLQEWLGSHGVSSDYSIDYQLEGTGEQQIDVSGTSADQVKQLLASKPDWLTQLRQIAASLQSQTSAMSNGGSVDAANITITDSEFRLS